MTTGLIEQRHPTLAALLRHWNAGVTDYVKLAPTLAAFVVSLQQRNEDDADWIIMSSGLGVDDLYGQSLAGNSVALLSHRAGDIREQACAARDGGRPLLVEEDIVLPTGRRRKASLYLPSGQKGAPTLILCGIVGLSRKRSATRGVGTVGVQTSM